MDVGLHPQVVRDLHPGQCPPRPPGVRGATARHRVHQWMRRALLGYADAHDGLVGDHTSRLSPYLRFGCLSPLRLAHLAAGSEASVRQSCWRHFYHQVTYAFPRINRGRLPPPQPPLARRRGRAAVLAQRHDRAAHRGTPACARSSPKAGCTTGPNSSWPPTWSSFSASPGTPVPDTLRPPARRRRGQQLGRLAMDRRHRRHPTQPRLNPLRQAQRCDPAGDCVRCYVPGARRRVHRPHPSALASGRTTGRLPPPPML